MAWTWFPNPSSRAGPRTVSYLWEIIKDNPHNTLLAKVYMHGDEFTYSIKDETRKEFIRVQCEKEIVRRQQALADLVAQRFKQADSIN